MSNESPLEMMRSPRRPLREPSARPTRRRRLRPVLAAVAVVVALALGWVWIWYYAASVAERTLAGWIDREAAAGRVYSCAAQSIGGFPFRLEARCADAVAEVRNHQPQLTVTAKTVIFAAAVYEPTVLVGQFTGPLTLAQSGQPPGFVADWARAWVSVRGRPPNPERVAIALDRPRLDRLGAVERVVFDAKHAELEGRVIAGLARDRPVIEATLHIDAATVPALHPLTARPVEVELDAVLRGLKDLAPKPWADRLREMQAAGGVVEIKSLRIASAEAMVVGSGRLSINAHGKLDGLIQVAIVGLDRLVPLLPFDWLVGRGAGPPGGASAGAGSTLGALDQLMPGIGAAVREGAAANLIDNLKRMGQQIEIDKRPAVVLPLRLADGSIYLGLLPLGAVPALF